MARQTFPYTQFSLPATAPFPNGQTVFRPLAVARLVASNGNTFRCIVWPDSGADGCVFPISFAIAMGLNPLTMKQQITGGVGNTGNVTYYEELTIEIGELNSGGTSQTFVPTLSFKTHAGFTAGLEAQGLGLLGQSGFFENYHVTFDHKKREFHIE